MSEANLQKQIRLRASLKSKLTIFSKFIADMQDKSEIIELDILQICERLEKIGKLIDEFEDIQNLIEGLDGVDQSEQFSERENFTNEYYKQIAIARSILATQQNIEHSNPDANDDQSLRSSPSQQNNYNLNSIKLPTIQLPKFDGSYQDWLEFRDTFESLIHSNSAITEIQKFHYLRAALQGGAAQVIHSLELSASNYAVAWATLGDRYNNTRLLVHNHVKALFNLENIGKESSNKLRKLVDSISKNLRALEQLKQPTKHWDTLLVHLIATKLDSVTSREWEKHRADKEVPTFDDLKSFLRSRADFLETIEVDQSEKKNTYRYTTKQNTRGFLASGNPTEIKIKCVFCKGDHYSQNCGEFLKLSLDAKNKKVRDLNLCTNCLRYGHLSKACRCTNCKRCQGRHHTLLCMRQANTDNTVTQTSSDKPLENISLSACNTVGNVLLSTARVLIFDKWGAAHTIRALLDCGSQSSYITDSLCKRLNITRTTASLRISGLNNTVSNVHEKCEITIKAIHSAFSTNLHCFVIPEITSNLPSTKVNISNLEIPSNITLSDPTFNEPSAIELLIGSDLFWELLCVGQISLGENRPVIQKTKLGWVISGPISKMQPDTVFCGFSKDKDIQSQLAKFWEIEECSKATVYSPMELACEKHFIEHSKRNADGRFTVSIPFKEPLSKLGESRDRAFRRFLNLERKLQGNPELKQEYSQFIQEYEDMGHMTKLQNGDNAKFSYYMPHHCVIRNDSSTTKLRVVFDASAPSSTGYSLNDLQMVGPTIQQDLISLLLRFRQHLYVVSADIAKMYRQVLIDPHQRPLQRILWRDNPSEQVREYQLNTVTYGTAAASFLAIRCLFELANEYENSFPKIARIIRTDFYVDDLLSGADSVEEAAQICCEVSNILKGGGFELRKFHSNNADVIKHISQDETKSQFVKLGMSENSKTLGLIWSADTDTLLFEIKTPSVNKFTKRTILSCISQIFDPLGLLGPTIIIAKLLMQKLWLEKLSWDESLPSHIQESWLNFTNDLVYLNNLRIPRLVISNNAIQIEMHGFSDASERAYGACIYVKSIDASGDTFIRLLCSKSKVAPLKTISLPRLELLGALMLTRLAEKVSASLSIKFNKRVFWTDSTVVLGWLKTPPNQLKTFVASRVTEIQQTTSSDFWRHVPGKNNPADYVSRGVKANQLQQLTSWWQGPPWMKDDSASWPGVEIVLDSLPELKKTVQVFAAQKLQSIITFESFSNINKIKRILAYVRRFINNCKNGSKKLAGPLSVTEINTALTDLILMTQLESFPEEISLLQKCKPIKANSKILNLSPFLDELGILRVGGRISNSDFSFSKKHPIIISSHHYVTKLLFRQKHYELLHAGPQQLLYAIREKYWPVAGRSLAKAIVRQCVICFRANPKTAQVIMGNLPPDRLKPHPPFHVTGVDYAGPLFIQDRKGRGCKISKVYISLFICFVTKAVHLELVTDLSKESFLLALRRFISRRGKPARIFSDNGKNFLAASSDLKDLGNFLKNKETDLIESFSREGIDWKFIPPYSPHFGGLWEAGVKSVKHHLKRVMGKAHLTFELLYTLLVQVEAVMNSRPLTYLSTDPKDLLPLTPAHFLLGKSLTSVPETDVRNVPENRLSIYNRIEQIKQHFWERWNKEFISEMQQRTKWKDSNVSLSKDALVVIKEDNTPTMNWKLGRIVEVHPGIDERTRVASILTIGGVIKRSFSKICPLPIERHQS